MPITDNFTSTDSGKSGKLPTLWSGTRAVAGAKEPWAHASVGSIYVRITAGSVAGYMKTTSDSDNGDWQPLTLGTALT